MSIDDLKSGPIKCLFQGDKAQTVTGLPITTLAVSFPEIADKPNSPFSKFAISMWGGSDSYCDILKYSDDNRQDMDSIRKNGINLLVDDQEINLVIRFVGGGDLLFIASCLALAGASADFCCTVCECKRSDFANPNIVSEMRTLEKIRSYAHLKLGKCPCCSKVIRTAAKEREAVTVFRKKTKHGKSYEQIHYGCKMGRHPLFGIEPNHYVMCVLHFVLRHVAMIFKYGIINNFDSVAGVSVCRAKLVYDYLRTLHIYIPKLKATTDKDIRGTLQKVSFNGNASKVVIDHFDHIIDLVLPPDNTSYVVQNARQKIDQVIKSFKPLKISLCTPLIDNSQSKRDALALQVQKQATRHHLCVIQAFGNDAIG